MNSSGGVASRTRSRTRFAHDIMGGTQSGSSSKSVQMNLREKPREENNTVLEDDYKLKGYDTDSLDDEYVQFHGMHVKHANGDSIRSCHHGMEIEIISEAEFRQTTHCRKSSLAVESGRGCAGKDNDDNTIKESTSVCPRTRWSRTSSDRSRQLDQNKCYADCNSALLQEDEKSHGSEHEIGIAGWTRSKRGVARKPIMVDDISLDLSDGSSSPGDSSLSDSPSSSEHEDCSDGIELLSDTHNEEESIDQHASKRQEFAPLKVHEDKVQVEVQLLGDSSKRTVGNIGNCSSRQDSSRNRPGSKRDHVQKSSSLLISQMFTETEFEEDEDDVGIDSSWTGRKSMKMWISSSGTSGARVAQRIGKEGKAPISKYDSSLKNKDSDKSNTALHDHSPTYEHVREKKAKVKFENNEQTSGRRFGARKYYDLYKDNTELEDDYELKAYDTDSLDDNDVQFLGMHIKHANGDSISRHCGMEIGVERISEAEFRQTHHGLKKESSLAAESARDYAGKDNDDDTIKESTSVCPRTRGSQTNLDRSRQLDQNKYYADCKSPLPQEDEERSHRSEHETGIASRTRSKRGVVRKTTTVDDISLDLSDGSSSPSDSRLSDSPSSSDHEADDSEDEEFAMEQYDCSDGIELSDSHDEQGSVDQHASNRPEFASLKVHQEEAQVEVQELGDSSKRTIGNISNCPSKRDSSRNRPGNRRDHVQKSSPLLSSQMFTKKEFKEDEDDEGIDHSWTGRKRMKLISSSRTSGTRAAQRMGKDGQASIRKYGLSQENEDSDKSNSALHHSSPTYEHARNKKARVKFENNEQMSGRRLCARKDYDLYKDLLDSVLDKTAEVKEDGSHEEAKQSPEHKDALPLKFRFEDEITTAVEKSESELIIERLFDEMELCLTYGDMDFNECHEVAKDTTSSPDDEANQYTQCCKGKHQLIKDDEIGVICKYCFHIELEAKHVMPPWAEKMYQGANRRFAGADQSSVLDGLDMEPGEDFAGSCNPRKGTIWDIKPGIRETMYEHQREGLEFLWKNLAGTTDLAQVKTAESRNLEGCIISHAPGTGKTRLTMVFLETYLKLYPDSRPLIITPASMLLTWEEEFRKWDVQFPFHNLNNLEISGKENKMILQRLPEGRSLNNTTVRTVKIYSWNKEQSILGMSYDLFKSLAWKKSENEPVTRILLEKPGLVVLDEGHIPRSQKSNIWNALLKLKTKKRIILSGTPFQNNFKELFNILRIVRPAVAGVLAKEKKFSEMISCRGRCSRKNYRDMEESQFSVSVMDTAIDDLKAAMAPFVHVHKGAILQQSLPGLRDCVILLRPPELQKSLIQRIEGLKNMFKFDHKVALISVHPYLFTQCRLTEEEKSGVDQAALEASKLIPFEGVKTRFMMELVRLSAVRNEKVLIFSQYLGPLDLIQDHLKGFFGWGEGKQILKMEGKMGQKDRQNLINAFNDPKSEAKVLLASTRCCSEGINLVGASRVVLLDVVWNPSVERQAICRAYRLGQKKIVYTYHLMTSGTTEGDKYCRQAEKERLSELVFTSSSNEQCKSMNADTSIDDGVLEDMVADVNLKDMFVKIIYQPKDKNLVETFSIAS
ncbi:UNVERIFIED_CONTAM: SNF2 domain-containing protein CLASSY 3 [Sesamum indicum]